MFAAASAAFGLNKNQETGENDESAARAARSASLVPQPSSIQTN